MIDRKQFSVSFDWPMEIYNCMYQFKMSDENVGDGGTIKEQNLGGGVRSRTNRDVSPDKTSIDLIFSFIMASKIHLKKLFEKTRIFDRNFVTQRASSKNIDMTIKYGRQKIKRRNVCDFASTTKEKEPEPNKYNYLFSFYNFYMFTRKIKMRPYCYDAR